MDTIFSGHLVIHLYVHLGTLPVLFVVMVLQLLTDEILPRLRFVIF